MTRESGEPLEQALRGRTTPCDIRRVFGIERQHEVNALIENPHTPQPQHAHPRSFTASHPRRVPR